MTKTAEPLPPSPDIVDGPDSDDEDDFDPTDDEGPAGPQPEPDPAIPRRRGARLRRVPGAVPGRLAVQEVILPRQSKFLAALARGLPKPEQILARATQNLDTAGYLETHFVTLGKTTEELSMPLPLKGKTKTCHLRTVVCYDPEYPSRFVDFPPLSY